MVKIGKFENKITSVTFPLYYAILESFRESFYALKIFNQSNVNSI